MEYVKKFIGAPAGDDVAAIKEENARLKDELAKVQKAFEDLNTRVRTNLIQENYVYAALGKT